MNETEVMISVRQKEGHNYPDGGWGTQLVVDMCPECFKDKLIPWINSQGGNIPEQEWDW